MTSKFELDQFAIAPTEEQFERFHKHDLLVFAFFNNIAVPGRALKREIKETLHKELVKQKVFPGVTVVKGVKATTGLRQLLLHLTIWRLRRQNSNLKMLLAWIPLILCQKTHCWQSG